MKEKELERLSESFSIDSETEGLFSNGGDMNFSGVRTVHTTQIQTYPLGQYDRTKEFGTGSRYGRTHEVGDTVMTYEMKDEVSFSLSIDKGNNADQFNMKSAGRVMEAQRKERVVPYLDAYRLRKFSENAGIHYESAPSEVALETFSSPAR